MGVMQQDEYELRVNQFEEIKQQLAEVWQSSNIALEWKDAISVMFGRNFTTNQQVFYFPTSPKH